MFKLGFAKRLGTRIFLTFTVALIVLSLLFGFITTHFGGQLVMRSSANELRVLSVVLSELIQNQFSNLEGNLEDISNNESLLVQLSDKTVQKEWLENYLNESIKSHPHLIDVMIYDMEGRCVGASDPDWYKIRGKNWKFFNKGIEGFNFPSIYGTESLGRVQLVSAPVTFENDVVGVIVAIIDLKDIYRLMDQKIGLSETTDAFLLDSDLRFITAGKSGEKGLVESHLISTALASHLKDEFWVGEYADSEGQNVLGTALKIPGYSWYVVVERNLEDAVKQIISLRRAVFLTTLGLLVVFIAASLALSRSITRPLLQLVQSTRQIAAGKYSEPVIQNQDIEEVAYIGAELERMRRKIALSQGRLKDKLSESENLRIESERLAAIGTLAASLAHEIRNPLNAMSLLLSRLQYSSNIDTRNAIMGDLFGEVGRLDRLVSSILDYSRPVQIVRRTVDVQELIISVVELFRSLAETRGVTIEHFFEKQILIQADPDRLKQCLVNLVKNALDALESLIDQQSGGKILVSCHETDEECFIQVEDNGPGIPTENHEKLFNPFFTTKENGTGLGLSSVKKIISAHGGSLEVQSPLTQNHMGSFGAGSRFIIRIPTI